MAFSGRFGSLIKQSGQAPMASMLNLYRSMSQSKLFIGGLSYGTDDQSLKDAFSGFGEVDEARVIIDRDTGRSKGFGFVNFCDSESASAAVSSMDGKELQGRSIRVSFANERPPRNNFGGGGGYGGGSNYGSGGGGDAF